MTTTASEIIVPQPIASASMHLLRAIVTLGLTTLREAIRNRILMVVVAFTFMLVAFSMTTASISIGEQARLIVDMGLFSASAFGSIMAIVLTLSSFAREISSRTAYPVLVRPIPRAVFVLGKYTGLLCTLVVVTTLMVFATAVGIFVFGEKLPTSFWSSLYLVWLEMAVVIAVTLLFSCMASPVLAAIYSTTILIAGNLVSDIVSFAHRLADKQPITSNLLHALTYLLPDIERLSLRTQAANDLAVPSDFVAWASLYVGCYAATVLCLAMLIFSRRRTI